MRLLSVLLLTSVVVLCSPTAHAEVKRKTDVIYGHKFGVALTMDVFMPEKPNGCGIIWVTSGGWFSSREMIPKSFPTLLDRGYTVFAVVHGSQPKFQIPEAMSDMHRAVRFIRHNAKEWHITGDKLGVMGGSAGGHLSLVLATQGGKGDEKDKDEINRDSSAVQAVACLFPPTDFLNYGKPGHIVLGDDVLNFIKPAFPKAETKEEKNKLGHDISPIYFIRSNQPPVLIIHGDADKLVPLQQAEEFATKSKEAGANVKLIVRAGKGHGWPDFMQDVNIFGDWMDEHLRGIKPQEHSAAK